MRSMTDEGSREARECRDAPTPEFEPLTLSVVAGLLRKTPHPTFANAKATFSRKGRRDYSYLTPFSSAIASDTIGTYSSPRPCDTAMA
jgi:hypothetical protein